VSFQFCIKTVKPTFYNCRVSPPSTVFFDVDFTLIQPGPRFQGSGYEETCVRHGIQVDAAKFEAAVAAAAPLLESADHVYDERVFENYTRRIIELMGGSTPAAAAAARELFLAWAEHRHFELYPDAAPALRTLHAMGIRIGLISNTHRCLNTFDEHFGLGGIIDATVSSSEHGFMKPHESVFRAALGLMGVEAWDAVMVGDSLVHDIRGARDVGMRAVLLARGAPPAVVDEGVVVIRSLEELPDALMGN
jgi:putative hydrolase of the HAD superfamily